MHIRLVTAMVKDELRYMFWEVVLVAEGAVLKAAGVGVEERAPVMV
jgi:hypothetical protein